MNNHHLYIFTGAAICPNGQLDSQLPNLLAELQASPDNRFALVDYLPAVGERAARKAKPRSKRADYAFLPLPGPTVRRYEAIGRLLFGATGKRTVYLAFAYRTEDGAWGPKPPNLMAQTGDRWQPDWAPPAPGMLHQIMADYQVLPNQVTLVTPDQPSAWDAAATAAFITAQPWTAILNAHKGQL